MDLANLAETSRRLREALTTNTYAARTWRVVHERNGIPQRHPLPYSEIAWTRFLYSHKGCRVGFAHREHCMATHACDYRYAARIGRIIPLCCAYATRRTVIIRRRPYPHCLRLALMMKSSFVSKQSVESTYPDIGSDFFKMLPRTCMHISNSWRLVTHRRRYR